jgi:hypothetical protein
VQFAKSVKARKSPGSCAIRLFCSARTVQRGESPFQYFALFRIRMVRGSGPPTRQYRLIGYVVPGLWVGKNSDLTARELTRSLHGHFSCLVAFARLFSALFSRRQLRTNCAAHIFFRSGVVVRPVPPTPVRTSTCAPARTSISYKYRPFQHIQEYFSTMGLGFSRIWERMFGKKEMRILMVGLDAAGKVRCADKLG